MRMVLTTASSRLFSGVLFCLILSGNVSRLTAAEPAIAESRPSRYVEMILADEPIAYWRFDGQKPKVAANFSEISGLDATVNGQVSLESPGPRPLQFPAFGSTNQAARFSGQGNFLRVKDPGDDSVLDFTKGDAITLEAWVNPTQMAENQQVYILGKGRTTNKGFARENQNYALRLRGVGGTARISFLFRNAKNRGSNRDDYHRWNSNLGFVPGGGWHHVAVTYEFGNPKSIKGYLDGRPVSGTWDYGGETADAPVVDNDELWIGSSMGGSRSSTFNGDLDEIAIYRKVLSEKQIAQRVWARPIESFLVERELPKDAVLVEVLEGIPDQRSWNFPPIPARDAYEAPAFAFVDVPRKYNARGVQTDRTNPFVLRATGMVTLPDREFRLLLRARNGARLFIDGKLVLETPFHTINGSAHGKIRHVEVIKNDTIRPLYVGDNEKVTTIRGDGKPHRLRLELLLGGNKKRPELGETSVSIEGEDGLFRILSPQEAWRFAITDEEFFAFREQDRLYQQELNAERRRIAGKEETKYWNQRHELARKMLADQSAIPVPKVQNESVVYNPIDHFINQKLEAAKIEPNQLVDDWAFLRRVTLDVVGTVPTPEQIEAFFADNPEGRRERYVEQLLKHPGWADHWVGYWQDVLAENPNIVNPTLNNTGPFRWWIHESFLDNKPFDRFATELIRMEGSKYYGGPGGFEMATQNDVPMAAKAHIVGQAFLGLEMKCARCHDAPFHDFKQSDLFQVAAMLRRGPQAVPPSSLIPGGDEFTKSLLVTVTLKPGEQVPPKWPFKELVPAENLESLISRSNDSREQLAALVTSPQNERFAQVIVNRIWQRYLGTGIVEPVDDWENGVNSHPELLNYLARELVKSGYDLKHVARLILNSHTYQRESRPSQGDEADTLFVGPIPRRMSAEQVVDSLFTACGKAFHAGELNIDADGSRVFTSSLNLGHPWRAWQFTSLSNERDRPSLSLPRAQAFLDVLESFGWRASRQDPVTVRDDAPTVLQPAVLANGVLGRRFTRCSEDSAFTELATQDLPLSTLIDRVIERSLTRPATPQERELFTALLKDGYADRTREATPEELKVEWLRNKGVSWSNHLSEESNRVQIELQKAVKQGDPPSPRLENDWRVRYEDMLWAILNSPEFVFVP